MCNASDSTMSVSKSLLTPLVTGVQEQCEFMLTLKDIMNNDDDMAKALDKSYVTICNLIHESPIVLASEALEVVKCLQTSPFAKPMRSELAKQIQDKVGAKKVNQSTKARQGSQLCLHWENYVSEARWQTILSDVKAQVRRLSVVIPSVKQTIVVCSCFLLCVVACSCFCFFAHRAH